MSLLGIHLAVHIGPSVPAPIPPFMVEALQSVEVTHTDEGRSGFQLVLRCGRGAGDLQDYALLTSDLIVPGNRLILVVTIGGEATVLMDGFITNQQFKPSAMPGASTLTLTGEDVSYKMDLEEKNLEHTGQSDETIVRTILSEYADYGLVAEVAAPEASEQPLATERIPVQQGTDLKFLQDLALEHGFVFYITPGPGQGQNTAWWGPPVRGQTPQPALSFNLGPETNVDSIDFEYDGLAAELYVGRLQDRDDNQTHDISTSGGSRTALAGGGPDIFAGAQTRSYRASGVSASQAFAQAQALTDASTENVARASGELDAGRYGRLLQARSLVDVRGVGFLFDGTWYVRSVTHKLERGIYKQQFTLAREGGGALSSAVQTN